MIRLNQTKDVNIPKAGIDGEVMKRRYYMYEPNGALEGLVDDLKDKSEALDHQVIHTNFLQSMIGESLLRWHASGVDQSKISEIRRRLYSK